MSKPDYPYQFKCAECKAVVIIRKSKPPKDNIYATDNANYPYEFHKCHISKIKPNYKDRIQGKSQETTPVPPPPMERVPDPEEIEMQRQELKQESKEKSTEKIEFKPADDLYKFGRTFKVTEVTLSKSCRVNKKTIAQLGDYEHKDYFISKKAEVEITNSFQELAREQFAEIQTAIDKEIVMDRLRLSGFEETDDEIE